MRLSVFFCAMMAVAVAARADVLPPAVAALQAKAAEAEAKLSEVKAQLDAARARYATLDGQLHALVGLALRARGYPPGFWAARSVIANQPGAAGVTGVVVRQSLEELAAARARAAELTALYGRMNAQMEQVRAVEAAYADARGRLLAAEKDVLRDAGVRADALSAALEEELHGRAVGLAADEVAVTASAAVEEPAPKPAAPAGPVWPVAGRVARPFHTGAGAMSEGVVLKAKAGAEVRTPLGGEVLYAGPFRQFGGVVIVKADSGESVLLGGLALLHVDRGNRVVSGGVVGALGDDGLLYWEVRRGEREIDPLRLVRGHR